MHAGDDAVLRAAVIANEGVALAGFGIGIPQEEVAAAGVAFVEVSPFIGVFLADLEPYGGLSWAAVTY